MAAPSCSPDDPSKEAHLLGDSLLNSLVGDKTEDEVFSAQNLGANSNGPVYVGNFGGMAGQQPISASQMSRNLPPWTKNQYFYDTRSGPLLQSDECLENRPNENCSRRSSLATAFDERLGVPGHNLPTHQNWDSFYTPFGPVKAPTQEPVFNWAANKPAPVALKSSSSVSNSQASSPNLPPKSGAKSYRDVLSKPSVGTSGQPSNASNSAEFDDLAAKLRRESLVRATKSQNVTVRKNSAASILLKVPLRTQSSSDSLSESSQGFVAPISKDNSDDSESEKSAILGKKLTNLYRKNVQKADFGPKLSSTIDTEQNAFKKNATTATESHDFQKITRKKSKIVAQNSSNSLPLSNEGQNSGPRKLAQDVEVHNVQKNGSKQAIKKGLVLEKENFNSRFSVLKSPGTPKNQEISAGNFEQKLNNEEKATYFNPDFIFSNKTGQNNKNIMSIRKGAYIKNDLSPISSIKPDQLISDESNHVTDLDDQEDLDESQSVLNDDVISGNDFDEFLPINLTKKQQKNKNLAKFSDPSAVVLNPLNNKTQQKLNKKGGKNQNNDSGERLKRKKKQSSYLFDSFAYGIAACTYYVQSTVFWFINLIADIANQLMDIFLYCSKVLYSKISSFFLGACMDVQEYMRKTWLTIRKKEWSFIFWWRNRKKLNENSFGLETNIPLPNTGEEAMRRLLMCRGQDAYSILGVKPDCTDEELKHYYRRQAVLVHPDKNPSYGAEEAFKILAAAFELIGTPEHRREYDLENFHRSKAMQDLEEMLDRLREKMEEVRSTMHCDCGDKHRRFITDRELSSARYCRRCKIHHAAQNGDIWAESQWFGFLWYYFACMEGGIYDITEWAGCQKNNLKHIRPNEHFVKYRLTTGRNMRKSNNPTDSRGLSDADAEAIFNRLLDEKLNGVGSSRSSAGDFRSSQNQNDSNDFSMHSKFRPPSCTGDSSRPRKGGRRRKGGRVL